MGKELAYSTVLLSGFVQPGLSLGKAADYKTPCFTTDTKVLARAISPTFKLFLNSTSHWLDCTNPSKGSKTFQT